MSTLTYRPPSLLEVPGSKEVGVELYTLTKGDSMAGWRVGFVVGNAEMVAALGNLKSYLDYGTFQPIQIASIIALNEGDDYTRQVNTIYEGRRNTLCDGLERAGWKITRPKGTMFVWAEIPGPYADMGSLDIAIKLLQEAKVAVSPGIGFGSSADGYVRFALVEKRAPDPAGGPRHPPRPRQAVTPDLARSTSGDREVRLLGVVDEHTMCRESR